jgi:hypothetical protein
MCTQILHEAKIKHYRISQKRFTLKTAWLKSNDEESLVLKNRTIKGVQRAWIESSTQF